MFFGEAKDQADELITRDILFSQPVVTNKFKLIVDEASPSVAIKMDVIGMPPDKKYEADPVLDPISYEDGNYEGFIIYLTDVRATFIDSFTYYSNPFNHTKS